MPYSKAIVCLANSWKKSGSCVAGKEISAACDLGSWIRPVSDRPTHEISLAEQTYADGTRPALLDKIEVCLQEHVPKEYQVENHLICPDTRWIKTGTVSWSDLDTAIDECGDSLWLNGYGSTNGINDQIPYEQAKRLPDSLKLIEPDAISIVVAREGIFGRRAARAHFLLNGKNYVLKVTDPMASQHYCGLGNGRHVVASARLCVSLGEPFKGICYKLVAGIVTP